MKIEYANQLSGRAIGSIFFSAFGALWLFLAFYARQQLSISTLAVLAAGLIVLLAGAATLLRQAKRWPRLPADPVMSRRFTGVNVLQWIAISIVAFSFARFHIDAYVMSAITAIVGLHLFPLARLFRYPVHYATGAALVAWSIASTFIAPVNQLQSTAALGTGTILWLSAALTLILAFAAARGGDHRTPLTC